jgi:hypothetical protein
MSFIWHDGTGPKVAFDNEVANRELIPEANQPELNFFSQKMKFKRKQLFRTMIMIKSQFMNIMIAL